MNGSNKEAEGKSRRMLYTYKSNLREEEEDNKGQALPLPLKHIIVYAIPDLVHTC
jgi:hypothetical protein